MLCSGNGWWLLSWSRQPLSGNIEVLGCYWPDWRLISLGTHPRGLPFLSALTGVRNRWHPPYSWNHSRPGGTKEGFGTEWAHEGPKKLQEPQRVPFQVAMRCPMSCQTIGQTQPSCGLQSELRACHKKCRSPFVGGGSPSLKLSGEVLEVGKSRPS